MNKVLLVLDQAYAQSIILIITVLATVIIYYIQRKAARRDAARTIVIQIDILNSRIDSLARILGSDISKFDIDQFWQSEDIIDVNEWNKYRHLFVKKLHYNEIVSLTNYYDNVVLIGKQQARIKVAASEEMEAKIREGVAEGGTQIQVPTLYFHTIQQQYKKIVAERATIPYEQLKKIARM